MYVRAIYMFKRTALSKLRTQASSSTHTPAGNLIVVLCCDTNPENTLTPVCKCLDIPYSVFTSLAFFADWNTLVLLRGDVFNKELFVNLNDAILDGTNKSLLHTNIIEVVVKNFAEAEDLVFDIVACWVDELAALEISFVNEL